MKLSTRKQMKGTVDRSDAFTVERS